MKVQDVMTLTVTTCSLQDTLENVAQKLWEHDCGCLPVVDEGGRAIAMITDRDVCMAAWTTGKTLAELRVADSMSKHLVSCRPQEELAAVGQRMSKHAVRRVPVVDANGKIAGVLSLNDLACAIGNGQPRTTTADAATTAMRVLENVSRHRNALPRTEAAPKSPATLATPAMPVPASKEAPA